MLQYKGYFYRITNMAIIPNTGGPTVSENAEQMEAKQRAEEEFAQRWENADFTKASREFMEWLWIDEFDPNRQEAAKELVASQESEEEDPDEDLFAKLEAAEWNWDNQQITEWWNQHGAWNDVVESSAWNEAIEKSEQRDNQGKRTESELWEAHPENSEIELWEEIPWASSQEAPISWNESTEVLDASPQWEYTVLFENFATQWKITLNDLAKLQQWDINSENYATVIEGLEIDSEKKTELVWSLDYLTDTTRIQEAESELNTEFKDVFSEAQISSSSAEVVWRTDFHANAFNEVSQHYIGWDTKTPEERNTDLSMALSMAAESLWRWAQVNINAGNSETFNKNMSIARNTDISNTQRFEALAQISLITNRVDWIKWWRRTSEQMRISANRKLAEKGQLEHFQQLIAQYQQQSINSEARNLIAEQLQTLTQENNISSWEATALAWWELDIFSDSIQEWVPETA